MSLIEDDCARKLKPCPFCGNNKEIKYVNDFYGLWVFWCPSCHAQTASEDDWNTRPIEDELQAEIEKRTAELHYANTACMEMKR
ncbi:MAG TPA: hypothetical protein PK040_00390, partial [Anaerolineaceae bacterium]|nr:hypothetical protein [Anaerolineaceae bacterium]